MPCNKCIIDIICIEVCDKFIIPTNQTIKYYLMTNARFDRLKNYHQKNHIYSSYKINETETFCIRSDGSWEWHDLSQRYIDNNKYYKIRNNL